MNRSFPVGRLFGIQVRVHVVFLLLLALLLGQSFREGGSAQTIFLGSRFLLVFTFVLLHELGHCLVARAHGIRVYDIVLWPLGGIARLGRIPEDPATELKIALAGPAVNFALFTLFLLAAAATGDLPSQAFALETGGGSLGQWALAVNLLMGTFNLVPAFPLDGGRVFRAALARRLTYLEATRTAVRVGRSLALVAGIAALAAPSAFGIVLIAAFVFLSGAQELRSVEAREYDRRVRALERLGAGEPLR